MLGFLKKLFAKEVKEVEVAFDDLEEFLHNKAGPFEEQLKQDIQHLIDEVSKESKNVVSLLKELEKAELQNPNVNNRVKTVMQGNRDAFIKTLSRYFSELSVPFNNIEGVVDESKKIKKEMDNIANSTARSYAILTQFFAREIGNITDTIKKIDTHLKDMAHLIEDNTLTKIKEIRKELKEIKKATETKQRHEDNLKSTKQEKDQHADNATKTEKTIDEKKNSDVYKEFEQLLKEQTTLHDSIKKIEDTLFHDLGSIDKALKKYAKISIGHETLIEKYLENGGKALAEDTKLEIISALTDMKKVLNNNGLGLDEKRTEKTLHKVETLTKDYFERLQKQYTDAKKNVDDIISKIESHATKKEIEELERILREYQKKVERLDDTIKDLEQEISKINILELKNSVQKKIAEKLKDFPEKIVIKN